MNEKPAQLAPFIPLPKDLTSYDVVKTFAVIIMVIDHIGFYFFPDDLWWRAIGRIGFPVWFFLVGHASGRDLPPKLIWCVIILTLANFFAGMPVFALNALVTIALIRVLIDPVMDFALKSEKHLWLMSAGLLVLTVPTSMVADYGTMALITAMFGYLVRHKERVNDDALIMRFMIFALVTFVVLQQLIFGFSTQQFIFVAVGTAAVRMWLYYFKAETYPKLTTLATPPGKLFMRFCGSRTLEIYVVHLLAFKVLALMWMTRDMQFLQWSWY